MKKRFFPIALCSLLLFSGCRNEADIAIIGGSDSPTAIYMSSNLSDINWVGIGTIVLFIVVFIAFIYTKFISK